MKYLKIIFVFVALCTVSAIRSQTQPSKEATQKYILQIFKATYGYEEIRSDGNKYVIESGQLGDYITGPYIRHTVFSDCSFLSFARKSSTDNLCSYGYEYRGINWAKMQGIEDWNIALASTSPIKFLFIKFTTNILRMGVIGHRGQNCSDNGFSGTGEKQSVNHILFPYRNEDGVRERLVKALNHLSKLEKEEQAKNDIFGQ